MAAKTRVLIVDDQALVRQGIRSLLSLSPELEVEILRLLASGLSNREIARALALADGTVKNHVSNLMSKLGARDRTHAVFKGLELRLM